MARGSLRRRLVVVVVLLLGLGVATAAVGTFVATRQYLLQRTDADLVSVVRAVERAGTDAVDGSLWQALSEQGAVPAVVEVRDASGRPLRRTGTEPGPRTDLAPGPVSSELPDGMAFRSQDGGEGADWRIVVCWLPDGSGQLMIAARTSENDRLLRRLALIEALVGLLVLGGVAALAVPLVRRGMRPLDLIADTARAIAGGDLGRRVGHTDERTEVGRLGLALNAMLARIESAMREREDANGRLRRFIADASHELRTPVATVRGYAELFRRGAAERPDDLATAMRRIEAEAVRVSEMVDEMLLLARLDQGRPLERRPVDLTGIAVDAAAGVRAVAPERPVRVDATGPAMTLGDAARLRQVVDNLLANVCKHTPPGTGAVVELGVEEATVTLAVIDQGRGLSAAECDKVFERFYRGEEARSAPHAGAGGAGLGLSIVAAITAAHGGVASVTSTPGHGATFLIRLPRLPEPGVHTELSEPAHGTLGEV